jgi:hypothetical protein
MTTVIASVKYNPLFGKNGYSTVEKIKLMFIDCNTFENKIHDVDYIPSQNLITTSDDDEPDTSTYYFTNIQYEKINQKIKAMLKNVRTVLYKDIIDQKFFKYFVDADYVQFVKIT